MLDIIRRFRERAAAQKVRRHPAVVAATREMDRWLNDGTSALLDHLPAEEKQAHRAAVLRIAGETVQAERPLRVMREHLCNFVAEASRYDVLRQHLLDRTGNPVASVADSRISWALSRHVGDIAVKDEHLLALARASNADSMDAFLDYIALRCEIAQAYMAAINAMRSALDDAIADPAEDWFRPFYVEMCAWHEEIYRDKIGLPSLIGATQEEREAATLAFASFMNSVIEADPQPRSQYRGSRG